MTGKNLFLLLALAVAALALLAAFYMAARLPAEKTSQDSVAASAQTTPSAPPVAADMDAPEDVPPDTSPVPSEDERLRFPAPSLPMPEFRAAPVDPLLYQVEEVSTMPPRARQYEELSRLAPVNHHAAYRLYELIRRCELQEAGGLEDPGLEACGQITPLQRQEAPRWLSVARRAGNRQALLYGVAREDTPRLKLDVAEALWLDGYYLYLPDLAMLQEQHFELTGDPEALVHAFAARYLHAHLHAVSLLPHVDPVPGDMVNEAAGELLPRHVDAGIAQARAMLAGNPNCCSKGR